MRVKYIGKREQYRDALYGSGDWTQGQEKEVAQAVANKMLRHPDQYVAPEAKSASEEVSEEVEAVVVEEKAEDNTQDTRDLVAYMDKEQLDAFAMTNFKMKLHHNMTVENARARVIGLIDQYGMQ